MLTRCKARWQWAITAAAALALLAFVLYLLWPAAVFHGWFWAVSAWGRGVMLGLGLSLAYVGAALAVARVPELRQALRLGPVRLFAGVTLADVAAAAALALVEDLLFRGLLQPLWGIGWASLAFALAYAGSRLQFASVAALVEGLVLGAVYQSTGNLWITMLAHALHQSAAVCFWRWLAPGLYRTPVGTSRPSGTS